MRHDVWDLEPELREISEWADWIERELVPAGIDVPGAPTCFKFSASSIRFANDLKRVYRHLPNALRSKLIEASILHQCWRRSAELTGKNRALPSGRCGLPVVEGREFLATADGGHRLILASDGHEYAVRFPRRENGSALATEAICFEIARALALPTAPLALVEVNDRLAALAGFPIMRPECSTQRRGTVESQPCLGVRKIPSIPTDDDGQPSRPYSAKSRRFLVGAAVLQILTADVVVKEPCFVGRNGYAEPVFSDFSHSLCGADWNRFLSEDFAPESIGDRVRWVRTYAQLEYWVAKVERLDAERICEAAVKLPPTWYGMKPLMMVRVIQTLSIRATNLRHTVVRLMEAGFFPNARARLGSPPRPVLLSRPAVAAAR